MRTARQRQIVSLLVTLSACRGRVVPPQTAIDMGWNDVSTAADDDDKASEAASARNRVCRTVALGDKGGRPCVFPFIYKGRSYGMCTTASDDDDDGRPFCGTMGGMDVAGTAHVGICAQGCPKVEYGSVPTVAPAQLITAATCKTRVRKGCEKFWSHEDYITYKDDYCTWYPLRRRCHMTREGCAKRARKGCERFWSDADWTGARWDAYCSWYPQRSHCDHRHPEQFHRWQKRRKAAAKTNAWPPPHAHVVQRCVIPHKRWTWRCKNVGDVCLQGAGLVCKQATHPPQCLELPCWHPRSEEPPTKAPTGASSLVQYRRGMRRKIGPTWKQATANQEQVLLGVRFYCTKAFIPARAGGFRTHAHKQACCVLDKALDTAWVLHSVLYCSSFQDASWKAKCFDGQAQELVNDLVACCELRGRPQVAGDDDCRRSTVQALTFLANTVVPAFRRCTWRVENSNRDMVQSYMYYGDVQSRIFLKQARACFDAAGTLTAAIKKLLDASRKLYSSEAALTKASHKFLELCSASRRNFDCAQAIVRYMRTEYKNGWKLWPEGEPK